MAERDENVYKAKLAEQAERYDGKYVVDIISCVCKYVWWFKSPTSTRNPLKLFQRFHSIIAHEWNFFCWIFCHFGR